MNYEDPGTRVQKIIQVYVMGDGTVDATAFIPASSSLQGDNTSSMQCSVDEAIDFIRSELGDTKIRLFGENLARARRVLRQQLSRK